MKVGILAGGYGTRLAEETEIRPKPMVEIGGMPILWHLMMHYSHYGHREFAIALGYKGDYIKRWFNDFGTLGGNLRVEMKNGKVVRTANGNRPDWTVDLIDTGASTLTGGRIKRLKDYFGNETFLLTWGDGVSNVDLDALVRFHRSHGKLATVTAVRPPARYGNLEFDGDQVTMYMLIPQMKQYMKTVGIAGDLEDEGPALMFGSPNDDEHPCRSDPDVSCEKIGADTFLGRPVDKYRVTDVEDGYPVESTIWFDRELLFPIKIEDSDGTMEATSIEIGSQPDELFEIPADFSEMQMPF